MIKFKDLKDDTVEKFYCTKFGNLKVREFTRDEAEIFIRINLLDDQACTEILNDENNFIGNLINKSMPIRFPQFQVSNHLKVLMSVLCDTPGKVVMYYAYFRYLSFKYKINKIDTWRFSREFPMGIPTEEELSKLWREQKIDFSDENNRAGLGSDNLLDHSRCYNSMTLN